MTATHPPVSYHNFPPGLWSPSQPKSVTTHRLVPTCTASCQRHMGVNNLPKVVTRQRGGRGSNSRPLNHPSDALATRLSSHPMWYTRPKTVTHPSTNRARRRVTSLLRPTTLSQRQTANQHCHICCRLYYIVTNNVTLVAKMLIIFIHHEW